MSRKRVTVTLLLYPFRYFAIISDFFTDFVQPRILSGKPARPRMLTF